MPLPQIQPKTSAFKSLAKADYEKQTHDDFVIMCDFISENSETKLEFDFVINLIESHVENCIAKLNSALVDSFRVQLAAIMSNEKGWLIVCFLHCEICTKRPQAQTK